MIQVLINGKPVLRYDLPLGRVGGVVVNTRGFSLIVPRTQARVLMAYVYKAAMECEGVIMFNGIIVQKEDVKEIKF